MANVHSTISTTPADCLSQVSTALSSKYSTAYTEHYKTATDLIFTCTSISAKVIRINYASDMDTNMYYGDAWTSGTTITNSVQFLGHYAQANAMSSINIVLGDSFFLWNSLGTDSDVYSLISVIAKTTAGDSVVFGFQPTTTVFYTISKNITTGAAIAFSDFYTPFLGTDSKVYKTPVVMFDTSSNIVLMNGTSIATITGLYMSSWNFGNTANLVGATYLITSGRLYSSSATLRLYTGLLAEWTT